MKTRTTNTEREELEKKLKHCPKCGQKETLTVDSNIAIASCDKCNYARFLKGTPIALG